MISEGEIKSERDKLKRLAKRLEHTGDHDNVPLRMCYTGYDVLGFALGLGPPLSRQIEDVLKYLKEANRGKPQEV